jgi:zinc and cadmium transporter
MANSITLFWIIGTCLAGGALSLLFAFLFLKKANSIILTNMVSLAVGTLLGAVFLEILPHALELSSNFHTTTLAVLIGILVFFILEKLLIWRHCHGSHCENHSSDVHFEMNKKGSFVLIGDLFHNFIDGSLIATAFLFDIKLGLVTSLAIFAHEIPQEMGNISILVQSGFKTSKAILFNIIASIAMIIGAIFAYYLIDSVSELLPLLLAFAASSMIYVAVSDLIPGLHKKTQPNESVMQVIMIAIGVAIIYIIHLYLH